MNRPLKFRAWHKNLNIMIYDAMEIKNIGLGDGSVIVDTRTQDGSELIWMQYIGLKDMNDKEIYEGDIVTMHQFLFDGSEHEEECTGVIGYLVAEFSLKQIKSKFLQQHTGYSEGEFETPLCNFYGLHEESFEVIGNIHQNPELLNEKQKIKSTK